jgi:hypothetical protein
MVNIIHVSSDVGIIHVPPDVGVVGAMEIGHCGGLGHASKMGVGKRGGAWPPHSIATVILPIILTSRTFLGGHWVSESIPLPKVCERYAKGY